MNPDRIAQLGQLSMLLELSSSPKPGNVDRCHDFEDIGFQDFLISAVASYPILRKAASGRYGIGRLILEAVESWKSWNIPGNTHFGSITLLVPLASAAASIATASKATAPTAAAPTAAASTAIASTFGPDISSSSNCDDPCQDGLRAALERVLKSTTIDDSVDFYRAFGLSGARVADVDEFSLKNNSSLDKLREEGKTLAELMRLSQGHDLIAREWSTCYKRSFQLSNLLARNVEDLGLNCGVVETYLQALAEEEDSLIAAKFGTEKASEVKDMAREALKGKTAKKEILKGAIALDEALIGEDVNPGSTADLISSSIFIALLKRAK
jgi:triphosphoribosyl-dephospho-CoA synthase